MSQYYHPKIGKLSDTDVKKLRSMMYYTNIDWTYDFEWADYYILIESINTRNIRVVNFLLDKGCHIQKPGSNMNPLHLAVKKLGLFNITVKLLALGARVTDVDDEGDTALHVAFFNYASDKVLDLLLQRYLMETDVNLFNKDGISFLHMACTRPNVEIIRGYVVRGQTDVNCQVSGFRNSRSMFSGCTPLHFAVEYKQPGIVRFLLDHNADSYIRDDSGSTALHYALERRDVKMIDLILSYESRYENIVNDFGLSHFMAACAGSDIGIVRHFLLSVNDSQQRSSVSDLIKETCSDIKFTGYTSMEFAAAFGRQETLEFLNDILEEESRIDDLARMPKEDEETRNANKMEGKSFQCSCYFGLLILCVLCFLSIITTLDCVIM